MSGLRKTQHCAGRSVHRQRPARPHSSTGVSDRRIPAFVVSPSSSSSIQKTLQPTNKGESCSVFVPQHTAISPPSLTSYTPAPNTFDPLSTFLRVRGTISSSVEVRKARASVAGERVEEGRVIMAVLVVGEGARKRREIGEVGRIGEGGDGGAGESGVIEMAESSRQRDAGGDGELERRRQ